MAAPAGMLQIVVLGLLTCQCFAAEDCVVKGSTLMQVQSSQVLGSQARSVTSMSPEEFAEGLVENAKKPDEADYDDTKDLIANGVTGAKDVVDFAMTPNLKTGGELIASIGAVAAILIPPPTGLVVGGILSLTGTLLGAFYKDPTPSTEDLIKSLQKALDKRFDKVDASLQQLQKTVDLLVGYTEAIWEDIHLNYRKIQDIDAAYDKGLQNIHAASMATFDKMAVVDEMKDFFIRQYNKFNTQPFRTFTKGDLKSLLTFSIARQQGDPWRAALQYQIYISTRMKLWAILYYGITFKQSAVTDNAIQITNMTKLQIEAYGHLINSTNFTFDTGDKFAGALKPIQFKFNDIINMSTHNLAVCHLKSLRVETAVRNILKPLKPLMCPSKDKVKLRGNPDLLYMKSGCGKVGKLLVENLLASASLQPEFEHPFDLYYGSDNLYRITWCKPNLSTFVSKDWDTNMYMVSNPQPSAQPATAFVVSGYEKLWKVNNSKSEFWSEPWYLRFIRDEESVALLHLNVGDGKDGVFLMSCPRRNNCNLYHVTRGTKQGELLSKGWTEPAMVSDGMGGVFIYDLATVYRVKKSNLKSYEKWSDGWLPNALATDNKGGLFIISRGNLYHLTDQRKNPNDDDIWSRDWLPDGMVWDGSDGVFIISRGNLYHVTKEKKNPGDGDIWSKGWRPNWMQRDENGGLFIWSRGNLRRVTSKQKKGSKPWGHSS